MWINPIDPHSTDEVAEQRVLLPGGADGGKGIATGKVNKNPACRTQSRVSTSMGLDGLRDRAKQQRRENMNIVASSPAARAVCGNSARTDLCGGDG